MTVVARIAGVLVFPLREIADERGAVLHMLRNDASDFVSFGECYFSELLPGMVKAWKRQLVQTLNLAVPVGRIRLVIMDGREDSPTLGVVDELEIGRPGSYVRVKVPPGLWYGFACVGSQAALIANCADCVHHPDEVERREADDPAFPRNWMSDLGTSTTL